MIRFTLLIFYIFIPYLSDCQNDIDSTRLYKFDISEILELAKQRQFENDYWDTETFLAGKTAEKNSEVPANITIYKQSTIENLSYYNLADLADITSGYSSYYIFGERIFETRGQKAGSFNNNKHLLLVDGIPINFARSYKAHAENELPLFFAQQIEFLRGPASALYGVSAFYGVLSLTPKQLDKNGSSAEARFSIGSPDRQIQFQGNILHRNNIGEGHLSTGYFSKKAGGNHVGSDEFEPDDLYRNWDDQNAIFLYGNYRLRRGKLKGLKFGTMYLRKEGSLGEFWGGKSSPINTLTWETFIPYLKYARKIGQNISINSYLKGNFSIENGLYATYNTYHTDAHGNPIYEDANGNIIPVNPFTEYLASTGNIEFLTEISYDLNTSTNVLFGLNYDRRKELGNGNSYFIESFSPDSTNIPIYRISEWNPSENFNTLSSYLQVKKTFDFLDALVITVGARQDYGFTESNTYFRISPRFGLVQKFNKNLNFKVLYSSALRAPGIKEVGLNQEKREFLASEGRANFIPKSIQAENIQSLEFTFFYKSKKIGGSLTYFYNITGNILDSRAIENVSFFSNLAGNITASGLELDLNFFPHEKVHIFSNASFAKALSDENQEFYGVPITKINTGAEISFLQKNNLNFVILNKSRDGYRLGNGEKTTPYSVWDANVRFAPAHFLTLEGQCRNIFSTEYRQVGGIGRRYDIPIAGRTFWFSLVLKF